MFVFEQSKFKKNNAKWGKQWGKHFQHLGAFVNTEMHRSEIESAINQAFESKTTINNEVKAVPAGSQKNPKFLLRIFCF